MKFHLIKFLEDVYNVNIVSCATYVFCNDENGKICILVGKRGETAPSGAGKINVPVGMVDKEDNDLKETAVREIKEETELEINPESLHFVSDEVWGKNGETGRNYYVKLNGTIKDHLIGKGDGENYKFFWLPVEDADTFDWAFGMNRTLKNVLELI